MLAILFIIFIGKFFYKLAEKYNQNKWLFGILGIAMYYVGSMIGGAIVGLMSVLLEFEIDWENQILMTFIAIPFGFAACWLFYYLLERTWKKNQEIPVENIEDIGKDIDEIGM